MPLMFVKPSENYKGRIKNIIFGGPVMMTAEVMEIMQWLHSHEGGNKDHSAIAQYYEFMTGMKLGE